MVVAHLFHERLGALLLGVIKKVRWFALSVDGGGYRRVRLVVRGAQLESL